MRQESAGWRLKPRRRQRESRLAAQIPRRHRRRQAAAAAAAGGQCREAATRVAPGARADNNGRGHLLLSV